MDIKQSTFESFTVYSCDDITSFIHIDINKPQTFYEKMFTHFFDETRLLNYTALYKKLAIFIDKENDVPIPPSLEPEILDVLKSEYQIVEEDGIKKIRLDKIGKIGEYIFSNFLSEYFKLECIIPKLNLITDPNMNVFGIDTLFYSPTNKLLLLGESKVSNSLDTASHLIFVNLSIASR